MELEGFSTSLQGLSVVLFVEKEEEAWVPWECVPEGMSILLCGKAPLTHRIVRDSYPWSSIWSPSTSREWSILATVLKAITGPITLVLDLDGPVPPFAFTEFLESLPSVTKFQIVKKGSSLGMLGHAHAIIWSDAISISSRMDVLQTLRYKEGEGAITAAVTAARDSKVLLMASDCEGSWKLYWIKPADSWVFVKRLGEFARCSLRTGMALLEL